MAKPWHVPESAIPIVLDASGWESTGQLGSCLRGLASRPLGDADARRNHPLLGYYTWGRTGPPA